MQTTEKMFRLKNMKMLETYHGVAWTADIYLNNKKVGWVEDDSKGVTLRSGFISLAIEQSFEAWSEVFGFAEWLEYDVASAGLYKLSEIYAFEVEGVKI